jgi:hypothetical protein
MESAQLVPHYRIIIGLFLDFCCFRFGLLTILLGPCTLQINPTFLARVVSKETMLLGPYKSHTNKPTLPSLKNLSLRALITKVYI